MKNLRRKLVVLFLYLIACLGLCLPLAADFNSGFEAYSKGDYATALKEWRPLAEQGNAGAQYLLGEMYYKGQGVPQSHTEAAKWYRLSAEQGNAEAQFSLGGLMLAPGVAQNSKEAVKWFRLSAEQAHADAQYFLGLMYATGDGVAQNDQEAVKWFRLATEQGNADYAQYELGRMNYLGRGVPQDYVQAHMWYNLASANGHTGAADPRMSAANRRDSVAKMMTPQQVAEAQGLASKWEKKSAPTPPQPRLQDNQPETAPLK